MADPDGVQSTNGDDHRWSRHLALVSWLAGALLLCSVGVGAWSYLRDARHDAAVERDNQLIIAMERLASALKDVETGQRGFIITGDESYLEPYTRGVAAVQVHLGVLRAGLGEAAATLVSLAEARIKSANEGIATARAGGSAAGADFVKRGTGKALMDAMRTEIRARLQDATNRIAAVRQDKGLDVSLRAGSLAGLVLACAALGFVAVQRRRQQQASQALLAGVLENAPVGLGFLDAGLRLGNVNGALSTMSEPSGAAPGTPLWQVFPQLEEAIGPALRDMVASGQGLINTDVVTGDPVKRYLQASFYPLRQTGRVGRHGAGLVVADVTARRLAERLTRESEERFRSLVEASAAIIWTADATGAFRQAQPSWSKFTGQSPDDMLGWGRLACVHPEDVDLTKAAWVEARISRAPIALEHRLRRWDRAWRYMALSAAPVLEEDGGLREWVGSHTDITERKDEERQLSAAKEAAEAANRAKSAFLANMSHELRTPLSAVIGYCEMLEEEVEDLGQAGLLADLGKIKSNARHLLNLINDVLDLSKIEANKMDVHAEDIDIDTFARDVAATVDALVKQKGNVFALDIGEGLGAMHSDVVKLRQCLFNLLSNASKFTENGRIELSIRREPAIGADWITFAVTDTGIGMTPDQLARLFQRFSQADETTTRRFGGTGLGLAISRAFSRLLGGDIAVESKEGEGTRFTLRIPSALPERVPDVEPSVAPDAASDDRPRNLVLVIDDEASQRELMTRFLERQGFEVRTAPDGRAGLALARSLKPRAILLDVMMPQMDGWSVLGALKADAELSRIPVVMVTFVADAGLGPSLGAADHVAKPVDWASLKHVMDRFRAEEAGDVLVVDDDAGARQRLRSVLEKNGWTVQEAGNGAEALDRVLHAPPRLILLDLTMPVMDGFSFLHRLRDTPGCADIPVVVLSARDVTSDERRRLSAADRILRKGDTSMRDLASEIRAIEERQAAERSGATN